MPRIKCWGKKVNGKKQGDVKRFGTWPDRQRQRERCGLRSHFKYPSFDFYSKFD